jgi:arabinogalactan endo-1,4-beta-galactosidase
VYDFTTHCLLTAKENGVLPEMIQIGNEITKGILWPICQLEGDDGKRGNYDNFFKVIGAGCRATRSVAPETQIVLHLERSNAGEVYQEFFTEAENRGIEYDVIGVSYYPFYHGTPDELFANLNACKRFGKEIVLAEVGYGFTTQSYSMGGKEIPLIITTGGITNPDITETYPITPEGQAAYIRDLISRCKENGVYGAFYWEPIWIPGENIHWASKAAQKYIHEEEYQTLNQWSNQCLFDYEGRKLPAFDEYKV